MHDENSQKRDDYRKASSTRNRCLFKTIIFDPIDIQ
jgi:hypothetical protein